MSDRSPEDELFAEAIKFGRSFQQMLRLYAQAGNWLDKRRIRKQISLALREQRRTEQSRRDHQLDWTQQMVDRYRVHAQTVAERATDPSIDHQRRYHDSQILADHGDFLRSKIIANPRLTPTEQGIALDGLDAATTFPHLKTGRLFDRAHKVKGIDALRYRAQVHRAKTSLNAADRERDTTAREYTRTVPRDAGRYRAHLSWSEPFTEARNETRVHDSEDAAMEWMRSRIDAATWKPDTMLLAQIGDTRDEYGVFYHAHGEPERIANNLAQTVAAAPRPLDRDTTEDVLAGIDEMQISVPQPQHESIQRFAAMVGPADVLHLDDHDYSKVAEQDRERRRLFATRDQAYEWTLRQLDGYARTSSRRGEDFTAMIRELDRPDSAEHVDGPLGMVTDEINTLRAQHRNDPQRARSTEPPDAGGDDSRLAEVERQLAAMATDRDRLGSRVEVLQQGLDAVTADRDEIRRKLGNAESQIESLKNRNQRLAAEIGQLRDRPNVDVVAAERDRYRRERNEAVAKLAQRTPAKDRYGSKERVEFDKLGNTKRWTPEPTTTDRNSTGDEASNEGAAADPDAVAREKFGWAVAEQMSADFVKEHGDVYDEAKMQQFARDWLTSHAENRIPQRDNSHSSGAERNGQSRNGIERSR